DAGVRRIQLADHFVGEIVDVLVLTDVLEERLVAGLDRVPVPPVHLLVVEPVLHHAPALVEDLRPLLTLVDLDREGEGDLRLAVLTRQLHLVDVLVLRVEDLAAVLRWRQSLEGTVRYFSPVLALDRHREQTRPPLIVRAEEDSASVGGEEVRLDAALAAGELDGSALDAVGVDGQRRRWRRLRLLIVVASSRTRGGRLPDPLADEWIVGVLGLAVQRHDEEVRD